jgi:hypothetical protein
MQGRRLGCGNLPQRFRSLRALTLVATSYPDTVEGWSGPLWEESPDWWIVSPIPHALIYLVSLEGLFFPFERQRAETECILYTRKTTNYGRRITIFH